MEKQKQDILAGNPLHPSARMEDTNQQSKAQPSPTSQDDKEAKQDLKDDESIMDLGSGSGGGSAGDGAAS